jgi:hypothetical protein
MTDLEFLARLHRELTTSPYWSDIRGVLTPADDPSLADNELRVFPDAAPDATGRVDVFRVIVEWETGTDRSFP